MVEQKTQLSAAERAARESAAYDEGQVWANNNRWQRRVEHVLHCPNTLWGEERFDEEARRALRDTPGRALDIGCGLGDTSARLLELGARSVLGVDVSQEEISEAQASFGSDDRLAFEVVDVQQPMRGQYDLLIGRSILHHIFLRDALRQWYDENLASGGAMIFMEPMAHPLTLAFHKLVPSAHTPDEWPIMPGDIRWMRESFDRVAVAAINLVSFPVAAASSIVASSADNSATRVAHSIDRVVGQRRYLSSFGRQGLIVVGKSA